ncbi:MAG: phospholipid carrier-dependent glycosyltransferase [Candidatus Thermoplasmatota archaeon]|nr:phospholipid carrier-dependent glycosyltransferase [Candidatus Thermoplasmatota archaeon]
MLSENRPGAIQRCIPYAAVLVLSGILRFYNLMNPFTFPGYSGSLGNNGTDEGIFLMAGRLLNEGHRMYSEINTQQGPVFSFVIELLNGNPLPVRSMTVMLSLAGIFGMILLSYHHGGRNVAMVSSLFLALNYAFFKESRHASFDLYATVLLIFGFLALQLYFKKVERKEDGQRRDPRKVILLLIITGALFSLSAMSKLFAVIPMISVGAYMLFLYLRDRRSEIKSGVEPWHLIVLAVSTLVVILFSLSIYGFSNTVDGMLLDNLNRPWFSITEKLRTISLFLLFTSAPLVLSLVSISREWRHRTTQLMLVWVLPLFVFIILQSPLWEHYLILLLPPICCLGGKGFMILVADLKGSEREKGIGSFGTPWSVRKRWSSTLVMAGILYMVLSLGFETVMVFATDTVIERDIAKEVELLTDQEDIIISGDPMIGVYADRLQPPEATNLAMVRYPALTDEELINITVENNVSLVIFTYELSSYDLFIDFIKEHFDFYKAYTRSGTTSGIEGEIPIGFNSFNIYVNDAGIDTVSESDESPCRSS